MKSLQKIEKVLKSSEESFEGFVLKVRSGGYKNMSDKQISDLFLIKQTQIETLKWVLAD